MGNLTDHALASLIPTGAAHVARCVCGEKFTRRFWEQAEESHTKHAAEMARVAARRPSAAENRTAVEALHEPLFGEVS
ncbi:hypothetical protein OG874_00180 [Nocardia sp. NBC_00565]|uniref:hypothetical protein n=1 Tax=Nocardia sp. NBC_00565 TaxID=2975993 RepID=UPI002E81290F|nr:hypothetical protein [Nocardia sp. NBC_00565]WUC03671.1 hypothetical protein OG874_00180 [Nocardia sp. NBC_00565]